MKYTCSICDTSYETVSEARACEGKPCPQPLARDTPVRYRDDVWRTREHRLRSDHSYDYCLTRNTADNDDKGTHLVIGYTHEHEFTVIDPVETV